MWTVLQTSNAFKPVCFVVHVLLLPMVVEQQQILRKLADGG